MKRLRCALLLALLPPVLVVAVVSGVSSQREPFYLGGIQVNEEDTGRWVRTLKRVGMNTVAVTVYAKQGDWDSANLWWEETDLGIVPEVRAAHAEGLRVALVLRVALDHAFERNRFLWHGMILPQSARELDEWFRRYRRFCLQWAEIAQSEGIELLVVGSELNALASTRIVESLPVLEEYYLNRDKHRAYNRRILAFDERVEPQHLSVRGRADYRSLETYLDDRSETHRRWAEAVTRGGLEELNRRRRRLQAHWEALIGDVRETFRGELSFAANFDQYQEVGFWEDLDLLGINAYFPLRDEVVDFEDPIVLTPLLEAGWQEVLDEIVAYRRRQVLGDKAVIFTELGYPRRRNSTLRPWAASGFSLLSTGQAEELILWQEEPQELMERALAVEALRRVSKRRAPGLLRGILYWKLTTHPYHTDVEPFVLVVGPESADPLQAALLEFVQ